MADLTIDYIAEPKLQFGSFFEHEDSKTGLAEFGPFGKNVPGLHPKEIKLGFVGTRESISGARGWIEECRFPIESENTTKLKVQNDDSFGAGLFGDDLRSTTERPENIIDPVMVRYNKIINRDFVGFSADSPFSCDFSLNDRWDRSIQPHEIKAILEIGDKHDRIGRLVDLFDSQIRSLAETKPSPDIIILALTQEMADEAHAVQVSGGFFFNFRRAIKARAMRWGIPIQLILRSTILGKKSKGQNIPLQEKAARAWNFCTALYYKADGVPWRPTTFQQDTLFIGVDFYVASEGGEKVSMRSCVTQAFDHLGQGLILRGDPFEWDSQTEGRTPHLTTDAAQSLVTSTLNEYVRVKRSTPKRVVVHKPSRFWGIEHPTNNEIDGFESGIRSVFPSIETDLVALSQHGIKLFREGMYPPLRGTMFSVDGHYGIYTMGYIPYLQTFPGSYVPDPWHIVQHIGSSSPKELCREILELTKMNVNNCSYADGEPITLSFSHKVGEIMKHIPKERDGDLKTGYQFYM